MKLLLLCLVFTFASAQIFDIPVDQVARTVLYSFSAYCDWASINSLTDLRVIKSADTPSLLNFGFVGVSPSEKRIYVVFRGTVEQSISNIVEDMMMLPRVEPWFGYSQVPHTVRVHPGFYAAYQFLRNNITAGILLAQKLYNTSDIVFTGHSLGGALASIAAMDFWLQTDTLPQVITYGSPRVGNFYFAKYFAKVFGKNSFRFVNRNDFIPHMPFEDMGYYHFAIEHWFEYGTTWFKRCDKTGEDSKCSDSLPFSKWNLTDHSLYPRLYGLSDSLSTCNSPDMSQVHAYVESRSRKPDRVRRFGATQGYPL